MDTLKISINGLYLLSEDKIYFAKEDKSYELNELSFGTIVDILKENTVFSLNHNIHEKTDLIKFQRKSIGQLLENFNIDEKTKLLFEFEYKFSNLILENINENALSDSWDWLKEKGKKLGSSVLFKMGDTIFENLREALFSPIGIGVDTFLSVTGIGKIGVIAVWGMLGLWDISLALTNPSKFSWLNLIFDILGVAGTGALAKYTRGLFGGANGVLKFAGKGINEVVEMGMKNPKTAGVFVKIGNIIRNGASAIISTINAAGNILKNKLKLNWVGNALNKFSNYLGKILEAFGLVAKKGTTAGGVKTGLQTGGLAYGIEKAGSYRNNTNIENIIINNKNKPDFDGI